MRAIENRAFTHATTAEILMDEVGLQIAKALLHYYPKIQKITAYLGKGHNAGDALVALAHLKQAGWTINLRSEFPLEALAPLSHKKLTQLGIEYWHNQSAPAPESILLDGLLGIGATGNPRAEIATLINELNSHRNTLGCTTVAIDLPSGSIQIPDKYTKMRSSQISHSVSASQNLEFFRAKRPTLWVP